MGVKLKDWLQYDHSNEELRTAFYNMSKTMKYIHERDYYIKTFNLREIEILDLEKLSPIQYNTIVKAEDDEIKREDIYNLAFMQIGIYTGTLDNLKPHFLRDNFDGFIPFIPEEDVPYFRGIVTRGARVYYSDFVEEKNKREINKLDELTGEGREVGRQKSKSTAAGRAFADKDLKNLYSDINRPDAAFASYLALPILIFAIGIIMLIVFMLH